MVRGTAQKDLLEISKSKTDGWENSTVFLGNQPGGYKVSGKPCTPVDGHRVDHLKHANKSAYMQNKTGSIKRCTEKLHLSVSLPAAAVFFPASVS